MPKYMIEYEGREEGGQGYGYPEMKRVIKSCLSEVAAYVDKPKFKLWSLVDTPISVEDIKKAAADYEEAQRLSAAMEREAEERKTLARLKAKYEANRVRI